MLDRRSSSSLSFIRMDEHGSSPRLGVDSSWHSTLWRSSKDLPSIQTKLHKRWAIPACLFATTFGCFCLVTLALGLGLGLGWRRYGSTSRTLQVNNSSYYGISEGLEVISSSALINAKELALDTGFVVSNQPRTREYVFNISQALAAPDGFEKPMILANGQSPGPLIEVNIGDTVRVHVNNLMSNWRTTIHWHGIDQRNTTWMDGVTGVSQCGIPAGHNFTYEFRIDGQRGTFWWHAHSSVQYSDGLYGPIVS